MNFLNTTLYRLRHIFIISIVSLSVLSCGGAAIATAGISGTGIVFGVITGFGSIFVNGVEYETDNATFNVDGNLSASQDQLKIGMVVKLETTIFDNGTFEANNVIYDDSIEGPITSPITTVSTSKKEFTVMGVVVEVNDTTTSFDDTSSSTSPFGFDTIDTNDVVEVSGFLNTTTGKVSATLVEKRSVLIAGSTDTQVEMRGIVTGLIADTSFTLNGVNIKFTPTTPLDDLPNGLSDGLLVEVKGLYNNEIANDSFIQASEIEGEDDDGIGSGNPDTSVSVQGTIVGFSNANAQYSFSVSGVQVLIVNGTVPQTILDQLVEGLNVEVEGVILNGVLMADQVEIREGRSQYRAVVESVNSTAKTVRIGYPDVSGNFSDTILLKLDTKSIIVDQANRPLALSALNRSDEVRVEARAIDDERIVVSLKRRSFNSYKITGKVQASVENVSITIDGLLLPLDCTTGCYDPLLPDPIVVDTEVELEDEDKDGDFEEVSLPD